MTGSVKEELVDLSQTAWKRLRARLDGLADGPSLRTSPIDPSSSSGWVPSWPTPTSSYSRSKTLPAYAR